MTIGAIGLVVATGCAADDASPGQDVVPADDASTLDTTPTPTATSVRFADTRASVVALGEGAFALLGQSAGTLSVAAYDSAGQLQWQVAPIALSEALRPGEWVRDVQASGGPVGVLIGGTIPSSLWSIRERPWVMALDASGAPVRELGCDDVDPAICCATCGPEDGGPEFMPLRGTAALVAAPRSAAQKSRAVQRIDASGEVGPVVQVSFDDEFQYPHVQGSGVGAALVVDRTDVPGKAFAQGVRVQRVHVGGETLPEFTTFLTDASDVEARPNGETAVEGPDGRVAVAALFQPKQSQDRHLQAWLLEADGTVALSRTFDDKPYLDYPIALSPTPDGELLLGLSSHSFDEPRDAVRVYGVSRLRVSADAIGWRSDAMVPSAEGPTPGTTSLVALGDGRVAWGYDRADGGGALETVLDIDAFEDAEPEAPTLRVSPWLPEPGCSVPDGPRPGVPVRSICGLAIDVIDLGPGAGVEPLGDPWAEPKDFHPVWHTEGTVRVGDPSGRALWTAPTETSPEWRFLGRSGGSSPRVALLGRETIAIVDASDYRDPKEVACFPLPEREGGQAVRITMADDIAVLHWREPEGAFSELVVIDLSTGATAAILPGPGEAGYGHDGTWLVTPDGNELVLYSLTAEGATETARASVDKAWDMQGVTARGFYIDTSTDAGRAWDLTDGLAPWTVTRRGCGYDLSRDGESVSVSPAKSGRLAAGADLGCSPARISAGAAERLDDSRLVVSSNGEVVVLDVGSMPGTVTEVARLGEVRHDAIRPFYVVGDQIAIDRTDKGGDWGFESTSALDVWPTWDGAPSQVDLPGPVLSGRSDGTALWLLTEDSETTYGDGRTVFQRRLSRLVGTTLTTVTLGPNAAPWRLLVNEDARYVLHRDGHVDALDASGLVTAATNVSEPNKLTGDAAISNGLFWLKSGTSWRRFGTDLGEVASVDACLTLPSPVGPLPLVPVDAREGVQWTVASGPWGTGALFTAAVDGDSAPWPPVFTSVTVFPSGIGDVVILPSGTFVATGALFQVITPGR
ncbi:MAG: hypothetical protein IV100_12195 [Myxococcales bacterium]|nr:hypothetical protein [Myxococcales bacterium]